MTDQKVIKEAAEKYVTKGGKFREFTLVKDDTNFTKLSVCPFHFHMIKPELEPLKVIDIAALQSASAKIAKLEQENEKLFAALEVSKEVERTYSRLEAESWNKIHELQVEISKLRTEKQDWYNGAALNDLHIEQGEKIAKLTEALRSYKQFLENAPLESGVCCCGSTNCNSMVDGHSFVDSGHYAIELELKSLNEVLKSCEQYDEQTLENL